MGSGANRNKSLKMRTASAGLRYQRGEHDTMRKPGKIRGGTKKEDRESAIVSKGFAKGGYACIPSDPTPRKILEVTDSAHLRLEGFDDLVTPCTALSAKKPTNKKKQT